MKYIRDYIGPDQKPPVQPVINVLMVEISAKYNFYVDQMNYVCLLLKLFILVNEISYQNVISQKIYNLYFYSLIQACNQ